VQKAALVGHSWGSLIAMEAAARLKDRVTHAVLVGTAFPMKVSPALIEASLNEPEKALPWSTCSRAPPWRAALGAGPGHLGLRRGMALGRRVLRSNPKVNVFHRGFVACDRYAGGEAAMAALTCPVLFLLGGQDQMTHPKAAQA
jgi:pimeloyl-ACP methyl ester carboxylesterase